MIARSNRIQPTSSGGGVAKSREAAMAGEIFGAAGGVYVKGRSDVLRLAAPLGLSAAPLALVEIPVDSDDVVEVVMRGGLANDGAVAENVTFAAGTLAGMTYEWGENETNARLFQDVPAVIPVNSVASPRGLLLRGVFTVGGTAGILAITALGTAAATTSILANTILQWRKLT